jgi:hypothetical protein
MPGGRYTRRAMPGGRHRRSGNLDKSPWWRIWIDALGIDIPMTAVQQRERNAVIVCGVFCLCTKDDGDEEPDG